MIRYSTKISRSTWVSMPFWLVLCFWPIAVYLDFLVWLTKISFKITGTVIIMGWVYYLKMIKAAGVFAWRHLRNSRTYYQAPSTSRH